MSKYPKIGIRPTIDGRQGGVRESLEEKTMNLAKAVAELISAKINRHRLTHKYPCSVLFYPSFLGKSISASSSVNS